MLGKMLGPQMDASDVVDAQQPRNLLQQPKVKGHQKQMLMQNMQRPSQLGLPLRLQRPSQLGLQLRKRKPFPRVNSYEAHLSTAQLQLHLPAKSHRCGSTTNHAAKDVHGLHLSLPAKFHRHHPSLPAHLQPSASARRSTRATVARKSNLKVPRVKLVREAAPIDKACEGMNTIEYYSVVIKCISMDVFSCDGG